MPPPITATSLGPSKGLAASISKEGAVSSQYEESFIFHHQSAGLYGRIQGGSRDGYQPRIRSHRASISGLSPLMTL